MTSSTTEDRLKCKPTKKSENSDRDKKKKSKGCPSNCSKEKIRGNSNTLTVPTNQNHGSENGNFCGNSLTINVPLGTLASDIQRLSEQLTNMANTLELVLSRLPVSEAPTVPTPPTAPTTPIVKTTPDRKL